MCSKVYVILITTVYFAHIPILLNLGNKLQYLLLEYVCELSIVSIIILALFKHGKKHQVLRLTIKSQDPNSEFEDHLKVHRRP